MAKQWFSRMTQLEEELKTKVLLTKLHFVAISQFIYPSLFSRRQHLYFFYIRLVENGFERFLI